MITSLIKRVGILLVLSSTILMAQQPTKGVAKDKHLCVAFYNMENLFDTINQPKVMDEEFTPHGANRWTSERYHHKISNMSDVISRLGTPEGPDVLGMAEVENRGVLEDLIHTPKLAPMGYGIVHYDSPDFRGIDCALIYKKNRMTLLSSHTVPVPIPNRPNHKTRDLLYAKFKADDGEVLHFIVAHWPSRYGGEVVSLPGRMSAGQVTRRTCDSIMHTDPKAKVIVMGDLNDDPTSPSLKEGARVKYSVKNLKDDDLYTPMGDLYRDGYGTLAYRDAWNLFDIMMLSGALINTHSGYHVYKDPHHGYRAFIFNDKMLSQKEGRYKGYPLRTIVGGQFMGGYSDHFPVYLFLVR